MVQFQGKNITKERVIDELERFKNDYPNSNDYNNWINDKHYKYALEYEGFLYPPKYILSKITGSDLSGFSGGQQGANLVFSQLGFQIKDKTIRKRIWLIAPYNSKETKRFESAWGYDLSKGTIAIGWHQLGDVSGLSAEEVEVKVKEVYPDNDTSYITQVFDYFYRGISIGDIIVARKGVKQIIGIGKVVGTAFYDFEEGKRRVNSEEAPFTCSNFIKVEWEETNISFEEGQFPRDTLVEVTPDRKCYQFIQSILNGNKNATFVEATKWENEKNALLMRKKQIILYGPPGTGKTFNTRGIAIKLLKPAKEEAE